jgi:hypothetical protein
MKSSVVLRCARRLPALVLLASAATLSLGCASSVQPPAIATDTELGRVIVYRNGVAYFERFASAQDKKLTLVVPAARVDDFLKSLSVTDEKTGEAMPVSFPTSDGHGSEVVMTIKLPKTHGRLKISYVTESPAWKPTYRVVLGQDGQARLQGWAVVDNVSGEDWKNVRVGVGSTSALSFRYDLHSIRLVERETLSSGSLLAAAPPTGGSGPYGVADRKIRVLAGIDHADLAVMAGDEEIAHAEATQTSSGVSVPARDGHRLSPSAKGSGGRAYGAAKSPGGKRWKKDRAANRLRHLARQLRNERQRVRIEGFARDADSDPRIASLRRANALRDKLIANGVPASQIDAVGTGVINNKQAVRLTTELANYEARQAKEPPGAVADAQPLGHAHFVSAGPLTINAGHSAMVDILSADTRATRVYYFDPISPRGSKRFAFNAIRLVNPSEYTLDSGPFTVYAKGQFLGEGLSDPILPKSTAFIPYALDRSILIERDASNREEIERLVAIQRGIVTTESRRIRSHKLTLNNRGKQDAQVYVRHKLTTGYTLSKTKFKVEKLAGAYLFPVHVKAGQSVELIIEEWSPIMKTVDIRTDRGIKAIALYLHKKRLDPELVAKLRTIVKGHSARTDLDERIATLDDQMRVYRRRVNEINIQLVTLRRVPQAVRLRRHLAKKMEEISNKLQDATMQLTDLKGQLMTMTIELQDKLAELTLKTRKDRVSAGAVHEEPSS